MDDSKIERLQDNLRSLHKAASTWVILVVSLAAAAFLGLSTDEQAAIIHSLPIPAPWFPLISGFVALAAKAIPQAFALRNSSSADTKDPT